MKKGFPNRILFFPYGWSDKGKVSGDYKGDETETVTCHSFCKTRARVGKESGKIFLYCPKCLVKLKLR